MNRTTALFAAATLVLPGVASAKARSGRTFTGENPLGTSRAEFAALQDSMELVYQRRYPLALEGFEEAGVFFPDSPLGPVGMALTYQAMMFENYDYAWEKQYLQEAAEAQGRFDRLASGSSGQGWTLFLLAVHQGLDAMYSLRKENYLYAFNKAWDALENVKTVQKLAPTFHDVQLAFGLYNYWRTAITEEAPYLPKFGDHREEGLAQMRIAKEKGLVASAPASLSLTYSYLDSKRYDEAIAEASWARGRYPANVINETTLARVYKQMKRYDDAIAILKNLALIAPDCKRTVWNLAETYYAARSMNEDAKKAYQSYLTSNPLPEYRAHTYYRLGLIERRQRHYDQAISYLEQAVKTWPKFKSAQAQLEQTKKERDARASRSSAPPAKPRSGEKPAPSGASLVAPR